MPRRLLAATLASLLMIGLAGCDLFGSEEAEENPEDRIVGAWRITSQSMTTLLTVSEEQTTLDPMEPGDGQLTVSGDARAELTHVRYGYSFGDGTTLFASPAPVNQFGGVPSLEQTVTLAVTQRASGAQGAEVEADDETYRAEQPTSVDADFEEGSISLDEAAFSTSSGASVTVDGDLTGATITLPAGEPREILKQTLTVPDTIDVVYEFEEDGTLRATFPEEEGEGETNVEEWQWRIEDDRLFFIYEEESDSLELNYEFGDGEMRLEPVHQDACLEADDRQDCLRRNEVPYGLEEGTLSAITGRTPATFQRADEDEISRQRRVVTGNDASRYGPRRLFAEPAKPASAFGSPAR